MAYRAQLSPNRPPQSRSHLPPINNPRHPCAVGHLPLPLDDDAVPVAFVDTLKQHEAGLTKWVAQHERGRADSALIYARCRSDDFALSFGQGLRRSIDILAHHREV